MTLALVSTVQTATGTPVNHSAITGIATGDLYLEFAHNMGGGTAPVLDTTSTFTTLATGTDGAGRNYTYGYRVRTGTEGTLSTTSASTALADIFLGITGVDSTTQIESFQSTNGSFSATQTVPASTPTTDNCWHVIAFADSNDGTNTISTPPAGYTLLGNITASGQGSIYAYYKALGAGSSGVSTGTPSAVWTGSMLGLASGFIVRPSAGGGGPTFPAASSKRFNNQRHSFGLRS